MSENKQYTVDRRTTLKWVMSAVAASTAAACGKQDSAGDSAGASPASLSADLGQAAPVSGKPYGTDPDLINPVLTWEKTMTEAQLRVAGSLADMVIPEDEHSPAASAVGVPDFIDEWVSAPYPDQERDREIILGGLTWLEQEALDRFGAGFSKIDDQQRAKILDDIVDAKLAPEAQEQAAAFFDKFRFLTMGAFYSTPQGIADIGYIGNMPMAGPYPGPSAEALAHLKAALDGLGLDMPATE